MILLFIFKDNIEIRKSGLISFVESEFGFLIHRTIHTHQNVERKDKITVKIEILTPRVLILEP